MKLPRIRFPKWGYIVLPLCLALGAGNIIARVQQVTDDFRVMQIDVARIQTFVFQLHSIEEEAVADKHLSTMMAQTKEQLDQQAEAALLELQRAHPYSGVLKRAQATYIAYDAALDVEIPFLIRGNVDAAEKIAEDQVDPAYEHLKQALTQANTYYNNQAEDKNRLADIGTTLLLVCGAVCMGVFMQRTAHAQRTEAMQQVQRAEEERTRAVLETALNAVSSMEERYRSVVEQVKDVIFTTDAAGCWTFLNPAWTAITGFDIAESMGTGFWHTICEEDRAHSLLVFEAMRQRQNICDSYETRFKRKTGDLRWIEVRMQSTFDDTDTLTGFFGTLCDVTERKSAEERLEHQALHDALTGLPNRLLFQDRLGGALRRMAQMKTGVAVLFVDLDNFKFVNDSMGHEAGDALLKTIAQRLQASARRGDTIARVGGDEFTLLLENVVNTEDAACTAERFLVQLQQPVVLGTHQVFASASIGIAFSDNDGLAAEDLLRDADTAMYQAKTHGKSGFVVFDASMNADVLERMEIETGLRFVVEREELRVHYQPLIDLETGCMNGVEALVRWEHPERGLMPPGKFIPIAEETGAILPIGYWVLEEACRQMQAWKTEYPDYGAFTANVNLSGKQLQRPDVVERVRAILEKTGIAPCAVKLEITESVMMVDVEDTVAKLHALKALGVKLAMDDFGTGYSSMASLNLFPLDTVKIDRAFIKRLAEHRESESIVSAIITLSKALRFDVTGEGVETAEQVSQLQGLGCDIGQGYFFAKPLPADDLGNGIAAGPRHFAQTIGPASEPALTPSGEQSNKQSKESIEKTVEKYLRAA